MSEAQVSIPAGEPAAVPRTEGLWAWLEETFDRLSDFANPILVKEIRQSLKSRAFLVTFSAVLLLAWGWSILGVALRAPSIYYVPGGRYMLIGYYIISLLPLILVVPFSTFRSLAAECEDGTFELLSITDLRPWQLIVGKLLGAMLQIGIFLSALSPCLAITYFLRGIDFFMILLFIAALALISVLLSAFALLMAAQARQSRFQSASAIVLLLALLFIGFGIGSAGVGIIFSGAVVDFRNHYVWIAIAASISIVGCILSLLVLAAAASITFPSDNRATALRIAMLVTHGVWFGWVTYIWQQAEQNDAVLYAYIFPAMAFWWIAAAFASGENTQLTPRVRRGLPESFLGRMFGTVFFPGQGIGYFFVLGNLITMLVLVAFLDLQSKGDDLSPFTAMIGVAYIAAYVGLATLILRGSGKFGLHGPVRGLFANLALLLFGIFIPLSIQMTYTSRFGDSYHPMQASNPFWTMYEIVEGDLGDLFNAAGTIYLAPLIVVVLAVVMVGLNFMFAARELLATREATPARVQAEQSKGNQPSIEVVGPWDGPE